MDQVPYIFMVGSPRSGTTILGEVLDHLPSVGTWYEPSFVWDHYFRHAPNDVRLRRQAGEREIAYIRQAFEDFRRVRDARMVLDKSPQNSLKMPFINEVFPEAKFLVLFRDGRETILSIYREWQRRISILGNTNRLGRLAGSAKAVWTAMMRQPLMRHRRQFIAFHMGSPSECLRGDFLLLRRWKGQVGWGPQWEGWQEYFGKVPVLEFCARQWVGTVQNIIHSLPKLPEDRFMTVYYEQYTKDPEANFQKIAEFLGVDYPPGFMDSIPRINPDNTDKWRSNFTEQDLQMMGPIVSDTLIDLGYEKDHGWYKNPDRDQG